MVVKLEDRSKDRFNIGRISCPITTCYDILRAMSGLGSSKRLFFGVTSMISMSFF